MKTYTVKTDEEARKLITSLSHENQIVFEEVSRLKAKYGESFFDETCYDDFQTQNGFNIGNNITINIDEVNNG